MNNQQDLSRRERQIMDAIYLLGEATAIEVADQIPDPPSRTAVRTMLGLLAEKKLVKYSKRGRQFVYQPTDSPTKAGRSAFKNLVNTFFQGSVENALASHLADPKTNFSESELKQLEKIIRDARREKN